LFNSEILLLLASIAGIGSFLLAIIPYIIGSRRLSRPLRIQVLRTEYVHLVEYSRWQWGLPWSVPRYSFLKDRMQKEKLHLPEGEIAIDFSIANEHRTIVTNKIFLEIMDHKVVPNGARYNGVRPVLKAHEDFALINSKQKQYSLFKDNKFSLKDGSVDLLRVSVLIANFESPAIFKLRLGIEHISGSKRFTSYSEPFYLAKYFGGQTNRNPYSSNKLNQWGKFDNSLKSYLKPDLYLTGLYQHTYEDEGIFKLRSTRNCLSYVKDNLIQTLLSNPRLPIQKYGFVKNDEPVDESLLIRNFGTSSTPVGNIVIFSYLDELKDSERVWIYSRQRTEDYQNFKTAVRKIALKGSQNEQKEVIRLLLELSLDDKADIAVHLDIISLLGLIPHFEAYDRIVEYLSFRNPLIEDRAAEMLSHTRYSQASHGLLSIVKRGNTFAAPTAYSALSMCGTEDTARELYDFIQSSSTGTDVIDKVKETIIDISPNLARGWDALYDDIDDNHNQIQNFQSKSVNHNNQSNSVNIKKREQIIFYILPSGDKYHQEGCRFLDGREIEIEMVDAYRLYQPCHFCNTKV